MDIDPQGSVQSALRVERQSRAGVTSYSAFPDEAGRCLPTQRKSNLDLVLANARELREEHEINRVAGITIFLVSGSMSMPWIITISSFLILPPPPGF